MRKTGCAKHAQFQADSIPVVFTTIVTFHVQNCKNAGAPKQFKLLSMNAFVPHFKLFFEGKNTLDSPWGGWSQRVCPHPDIYAPESSNNPNKQRSHSFGFSVTGVFALITQLLVSAVGDLNVKVHLLFSNSAKTLNLFFEALIPVLLSNCHLMMPQIITLHIMICIPWTWSFQCSLNKNYGKLFFLEGSSIFAKYFPCNFWRFTLLNDKTTSSSASKSHGDHGRWRANMSGQESSCHTHMPFHMDNLSSQLTKL